jgi:hypothetical protein
VCVSIRCREIDASVEVVSTGHQECGTRTNTWYDTGKRGEFSIHAASDAILCGYTQLWSVVETSGVWKNNEELIVMGMSDAMYASDLDTQRSVMGRTTFLNGAPVIMKLNMQRYSDLSVTESELGSATETAQDMLFVMRILESMGLRMKKPMLLYIDNKGAKDLANSWSVGGRTHHVEVWMYFLRELKEQDLIHCVWKSRLEMCSDLFTKNLPRDVFEKHTMVYSSRNEYMKSEVGNIQVEEGDGHGDVPSWYLDESVRDGLVTQPVNPSSTQPPEAQDRLTNPNYN